MHLIADAAARLGSRFNLIFDPYDRCVYQNAYGEFRERPLDMAVGVRTPDGKLWALPFTQKHSAFPFVEQFSTLTSIEYRAVHPGLGVELTMRVRAPFYPRDLRISTAPFCYVDIEVRQLQRFRWERCESPLGGGELVFELAGDGVEFSRAREGFRYVFPSTARARWGGPDTTAEVESWVERAHAGGAQAGAQPESGLRLGFDLAETGSARMSLLWSTWQPRPVLQVFGEKTRFKYVEAFGSRKAMLAWARGQREDIERRCAFLDRAVLDWSLGASASNMAALAFHSFLVDTWWTTRGDGRDWFSVWEGSCFFHSTVDVEYNDALLYLALWPELLEMLLDEWADFASDGAQTLGPDGQGTAFLCHDMGSDYMVGRQVYPHHMEVEENANYLLMLAAWASFTGEAQKAAEKLPLCRRLAEFIVRADSTGNGIPDRGVANTIDDASPAVQYGREQVYLAVKVQAALWALAELEEKRGGRDSQAGRWRAFVLKGIRTVEENAWLGDHYAVTLTRTTKGLTDPWTGKPMEPGELAGWDDYSIYTANGLLYLFLGGLEMPGWRMQRFADDLENADRAAMTVYGGRHSSTADRTVWFSQNMWRDYVAAYLGVDLLANVERYWDYQAATGHNWRASLYYDTTEGNNLNFYPRGATVFGMPLSAAGLRLSRLDGRLTLAPLRGTLRVPLLPLADWEGMRLPVLSVSSRQGAALVRISEPDLLEGLKLSVLGCRLAPQDPSR